MKHVKQFSNLFESAEEPVNYSAADIIQLVDMNLITLSALHVFTKMIYFNHILEDAGFSKARMHGMAMTVVSYEVLGNTFGDEIGRMQAVIIAGPLPSIEKLHDGLSTLIGDSVYQCEIKPMGDFTKVHMAKWRKLLTSRN